MKTSVVHSAISTLLEKSNYLSATSPISNPQEFSSIFTRAHQECRKCYALRTGAEETDAKLNAFISTPFPITVPWMKRLLNAYAENGIKEVVFQPVMDSDFFEDDLYKWRFSKNSCLSSILDLFCNSAELINTNICSSTFHEISVFVSCRVYSNCKIAKKVK